MRKLGLIGYPLSHSFSKKYYLEKFSNEGIKHIDYDLYPIPSINDFKALYNNTANLYGVNVTIPYKQEVIPLLNELSEEAKEIAAVNCIQIKRIEGQSEPYLKGFNTDAYGFSESIKPLLKSHHKKALILGNGGATKAVIYSLKQLGIDYQIVSRKANGQSLSYDQLNENIIKDHLLIINCSPVGTYPNLDECPNIPYSGISKEHLLYDLIYNPEETKFLTIGKSKGATIKNGYEMLILQAEKNWEIWNQE
ncbi:shikimate dehydrogenase family protein [Sphingobacterium sp. HJSM2_6]|uniref:shikimate dehydrogenase family protein n=1 Tax=Sphingobacterium sp. HJSM2_6 TaxID=3366264 RepID=UPI003BBAA957